MIILSMLGTGNYTETTYVLGEQHCKTKFVPHALADWYPEAQIKLMVTAEASAMHGEMIKALIPRAQLIPIAAGRSEVEYWQIFNTIAEALPVDSTVAFDMTHGFRSLPMLTFLAIAFLRAAQKIQLQMLLYGAYETGQTQTPILDLTAFVSMLDWANATNRFLETGDARKFKPLISEQRAAPLNKIAGTLEKLSKATAFNRAIETGELSASVVTEIRTARTQPWESKHQPFNLLLKRIEQQFAPLSTTQPERRFQAEFALINWYRMHERYEQAIGLARELLVSVRVWKTSGSTTEINQKQREEAENWLNAHERAYGESKSAPSEWQSALKLWHELTDVRNDLMHFGMRQSRLKADGLERNVKKLDRLPEAVAPLGLELPEVSI